MKRLLILALGLGALAATTAVAQQPDNIVLREGATKQLSPHVWAIYGNSNIAVVVGSKATLVVDTGLGNRNGAFILGEVAKLRKSPKLFLTTTHIHAEHASGQMVREHVPRAGIARAEQPLTPRRCPPALAPPDSCEWPCGSAVRQSRPSAPGHSRVP